MSSSTDPDNAVHTTLRVIWVSGVALGALWVTATQFDETEIKAWAPMLAAVIGSEVFRKYQTKRWGSDGNNLPPGAGRQ